MQRKHKILIIVGCIVLAMLLAASATWYFYFVIDPAQKQKGSVVLQKEALQLFFPLSTTKLGKRTLEVRIDASDKERAELIIRELKKEKILPPGVQLREVAVGLDGVLYLNLSRGLMEVQAGAPSEILMVYSLVNSFVASFKETRTVQLLFDGQPVYTIRGVVYTYMPLEFNRELLED
jgi:hypothetical protein